MKILCLPDYIKTKEEYEDLIESFKWLYLNTYKNNNEDKQYSLNGFLRDLANDAFDKGIISDNLPYVMDTQDNNILRVIKPTNNYTKRDTIEADIAEMNYEEE